MGKTYASSDWHGNWKVAEKIFNFLNKDNTLYFLGDAIDRGPDGIKIFKKLIANPRINFIKGNHEEMMEKVIPYIWKEMKDISYYAGGREDYQNWMNNGGEKTMEAFWTMSDDEINLILKTLKSLPTKLVYKSPLGHEVILEHAGYTPGIQHRTHSPLWDREHFHDSWNHKEYDNTYLVHGHTPVQYLKFQYGYKTMEPITKEERLHKHDWWKSKENTNPQVIRYCDGHKFDIDLCTIVSGRAALLDLDTFETIYFDED